MDTTADRLRYLLLGAVFIALAVLLPLLFHVFSESAGRMFSPLQLPIIVAALYVPVKYAALTGFLAPIVSSLLSGMPPIFPMALLMALECATYAIVLRLLVINGIKLLPAIILSMLCGRVVYAFIAGALFAKMLNAGGVIPILFSTFVHGWPAMVLQLVVVPACVRVVQPKHGGIR